jgi:predicted Zn-dependent protease
MNSQKWDSIDDILNYTDSVDPNNERTDRMRAYTRDLKNIMNNINVLSVKYKAQRATVNDCLTLARCYISVGKQNTALNVLATITSRKDINDNFSHLYTAAQLYTQCGMRGDAANIMKRALEKMPPNIDPRMKREMGFVLAEGGMSAEALRMIDQYLKDVPSDANAWMLIAVIKDRMGRTREAQEAFIKGYQVNPEIALQHFQNDPNINRIATPLMQRR